MGERIFSPSHFTLYELLLFSSLCAAASAAQSDAQRSSTGTMCAGCTSIFSGACQRQVTCPIPLWAKSTWIASRPPCPSFAETRASIPRFCNSGRTAPLIVPSKIANVASFPAGDLIARDVDALIPSKIF